MIYQVKETDLIGDIEGFPIEVVQMMVQRQFEQNGICDVLELQKCSLGGFTWSKTEEGVSFWSGILESKNFDLFFSRYPKEQPQRPTGSNIYFISYIVNRDGNLSVNSTDFEIDGYMTMYKLDYIRGILQAQEKCEQLTILNFVKF